MALFALVSVKHPFHESQWNPYETFHYPNPSSNPCRVGNLPSYPRPWRLTCLHKFKRQTCRRPRKEQSHLQLWLCLDKETEAYFFPRWKNESGLLSKRKAYNSNVRTSYCTEYCTEMASVQEEVLEQVPYQGKPVDGCRVYESEQYRFQYAKKESLVLSNANRDLGEEEAFPSSLELQEETPNSNANAEQSQSQEA
ncbi:hypothetical protein K435DRAFT_812196 [Dendrothele bispora CBS 962.96]|uniref:Uncharacterized protein n=1 Tax=Dendrothele bispora (strain CBS 962.96) TaxID=1314807 RepID=A0A4S8KQU6_DENBC|nr:hypothetical protein K435DRAFT_812196 [Dendrothele bispora CBS 962.96]